MAKASEEQLKRFISETMEEESSADCSEEAAHADDRETADVDYDMVLAEQRDLARILPDDVLADVFHRLAPRWLAASRCVRRSWRAAIDAGRHLRADLLPLSFHGIFLHFSDHKFPEFFARPTGAPAISGNLDFLPNTHTSMKFYDHGYYVDWGKYDILHHCNGLLLLNRYVVNPATRCWDRLPPQPRAPALPIEDVGGRTNFRKYLVFDPTLTPHYEVVTIPQLYTRNIENYSDPLLVKPSSPCVMRVFSSRSWQWELRSFVAEGDAAGNVSIVTLPELPHIAVYWRGALYVQRAANFVVSARQRSAPARKANGWKSPPPRALISPPPPARNPAAAGRLRRRPRCCAPPRVDPLARTSSWQRRPLRRAVTLARRSDERSWRSSSASSFPAPSRSPPRRRRNVVVVVLELANNMARPWCSPICSQGMHL
ncbi:hypothetical protein QYE76_034144 [Lolium multiflorum]|uniref:F-box domain-containing protein n=1 Tax=Lolium multiflorum TaxID=4521 RepID=A0AAD8QX45_LOLMU|nr:hypothetical protein QYE76_034144 [Lolium multiflorum]